MTQALIGSLLTAAGISAKNSTSVPWRPEKDTTLSGGHELFAHPESGLRASDFKPGGGA